jgi:hypothetical protein
MNGRRGGATLQTEPGLQASWSECRKPLDDMGFRHPFPLSQTLGQRWGNSPVRPGAAGWDRPDVSILMVGARLGRQPACSLLCLAGGVVDGWGALRGNVQLVKHSTQMVGCVNSRLKSGDLRQ